MAVELVVTLGGDDDDVTMNDKAMLNALCVLFVWSCAVVALDVDAELATEDQKFH